MVYPFGLTFIIYYDVDCDHRTDLTTVEKQTYIDADLCLMALPAKSGIKGAVSRWDELQYVHAAQGRYIHHVVRCKML